MISYYKKHKVSNAQFGVKGTLDELPETRPGGKVLFLYSNNHFGESFPFPDLQFVTRKWQSFFFKYPLENKKFLDIFYLGRFRYQSHHK